MRHRLEESVNGFAITPSMFLHAQIRFGALYKRNKNWRDFMKTLHKMFAKSLCVLLALSLVAGIMPMKVVIADDGLPPTVPVGIWISVDLPYMEMWGEGDGAMNYSMTDRSPGVSNVSIVIYRYGEYFKTVTTDVYGYARFFSYSLTRAEFNDMIEDGRMRPFDRYSARIASAGSYHFNPDVFPITFQDRFLSIRADVFLYVYPLRYGHIPIVEDGFGWLRCSASGYVNSVNAASVADMVGIQELFLTYQIGRRVNPTYHDIFCEINLFDGTAHIHMHDIRPDRERGDNIGVIHDDASSIAVPNVVDASVIQNVGVYGNDVTVLHMSDIEDGIYVLAWNMLRDEMGDSGQWYVRTLTLYSNESFYGDIWTQLSPPLSSSSPWLDDVPWRVDQGWRSRGGEQAFIIPAEYLPQDTGVIYEFTAAGITFHLKRVKAQE